MKVKELIEELAKLNPELDVVTSIDDEGNGYREHIWITVGHVQRYDEWEIEFSPYERDEEGEEIYPTVEVSPETATAVCLG